MNRVLTLAAVLCLGLPQASFAAIAYVTNSTDSVVRVDTTTNTVLAPIPLPAGSIPAGVAFTPDGRRAYVANIGAGNLSVIDAYAHTVLGAPIALGGEPYELKITPDGSRVYVSDAGAASLFNVVSTATNSVVDTQVVANFPSGFAFLPGGVKGYVGATGAGIVPFTLADNTLGPAIVAGSLVEAVAVNRAGTRAYALNEGDNTVSVIDTASDRVIATIAVGNRPRSIVISASGNRAWVGNYGDDTVSVLNLVKNRVTGAPIAVGRNPLALAMTADGQTIYTADSNSGTLSIIDTSTSTVVGAVTVGGNPTEIAIRPDPVKDGGAFGCFALLPLLLGAVLRRRRS